MEIAQQLLELSELNHLDKKKKESQAKIDELLKGATAATEEAKKAAEEFHERDLKHTEVEQERRGLESDIAAERDKLRKWQARAEKIRGERDYAALMSEIGGVKRNISNLEEKTLEVMQVVEDLNKELEEFRAKEEAARKVADEENAKVADDVKALEGEITTIDTNRQAILERLPKPTTARYEMVAAKRQGIGVAPISGEACTACNIGLPPQLCIQVVKGLVLEGCPSCSRILVGQSLAHSEESAAATAEAAESGGAGDAGASA
jgi:predicted  nucleic acid-binding Zn-ribbon protein